jgi:hypothetical protein
MQNGRCYHTLSILLRQVVLLVLSKIAKNLFSFFLFFFNSSFHVLDFGISEQFL